MKKLSIFSLITIVLLAGCATNTPLETRTDEQLYRDSQHDMAKGRYGNAVQALENLDSLYPFSKYSERSKKDIIYAYHQSDDLPMAVAAADRFIHVYPRSQYVDYAYYMRGLSNIEYDRLVTQKYLPIDLSQRDLKNAKKAFADFNELVRRFPNSEYSPDARQRMVYLRNLFAQHELNIAKHYAKRGAYVAAINRANEVVIQFDKTPHVREALLLIIDSYEKLGLTDSANETRKVYELNYAG